MHQKCCDATCSNKDITSRKSKRNNKAVTTSNFACCDICRKRLSPGECPLQSPCGKTQLERLRRSLPDEKRTHPMHQKSMVASNNFFASFL